MQVTVMLELDVGLPDSVNHLVFRKKVQCYANCIRLNHRASDSEYRFLRNGVGASPPSQPKAEIFRSRNFDFHKHYAITKP